MHYAPRRTKSKRCPKCGAKATEYVGRFCSACHYALLGRLPPAARERDKFERVDNPTLEEIAERAAKIRAEREANRIGFAERGPREVKTFPDSMFEE